MDWDSQNFVFLLLNLPHFTLAVYFICLIFCAYSSGKILSYIS
jgi:hypothetical protein